MRPYYKAPRQLSTTARAPRLSAQLARTEEAAKRALVRGDASARGGAAAALLEAQCELDKARGAIADLSAKLAR